MRLVVGARYPYNKNAPTNYLSNPDSLHLFAPGEGVVGSSSGSGSGSSSWNPENWINFGLKLPSSKKHWREEKESLTIDTAQASEQPG